MRAVRIPPRPVAAVVTALAVVGVVWVGSAELHRRPSGTATRHPSRSVRLPSAPASFPGSKRLLFRPSGLAEALIRARIRDIYDPILATLHLSPAVLNRVEELLLERLRSAQDVEELAKDAHLEPADVLTVRDEVQDDLDLEIADLAGSPAVEAIRRLEAVEPQLQQIHDGVAGDLALAGAPLTADQTLSLAEVLQAVYALPQAGGLQGSNLRAAGFDPASGLCAADRQILALAAAFLSPAQSEVLRRRLAQSTARYASG